MSDHLNINDIKNHLPHRYPFLLVDKIIAMEKGKSITGIKNVTFNESFFQGHFPGHPVMPGVLIIEALAQTSGVLIVSSMELAQEQSNIFYLAGIDKARFKRPVMPGDQLRLELEVTKARVGLWKFQGTAYVGDEVACTANIINVKPNE